MKKIFTLSENAKLEYSCTVIQIGDIKPIEGSDFLAQTLVNGNPVVIRKDMIKEGDVMVYAPIETVLNKKFLSANNLFEIGMYEMNSNSKQVEKLIEEGKKDEAKRMVGFFNKHGRVKMIRLRGCPSMGFLIEKESLVKWDKSLSCVDLNEYIGQDFDTINGELFVKVYIPYVPQISARRSRANKADKKIKGFSRMIDGEFKLHYDTSQLQRNIHYIKPDDKVFISNKLHGTSAVFANVLTRKPVQLNCVQKMFNKSNDRKISKLKKMNVTRYHDKRKVAKEINFLKSRHISDYKIGYGNVYSSRTVIKNKYINPNVTNGFYDVDVWGKYNNIIKPYILEGMTIYGEICGYIDETGKMIQKGYDYGCKTGDNFLMIYRITSTRDDGSKKEWDVDAVHKWTVKLINEHTELKGKVQPIPMLYHGTLKDLYPQIDTAEHWHENILEALRKDKEHFGMEELEPLCTSHEVPREGIVLRIQGDTVAEAFKLKCLRFLSRESAEYDKGNVDIEAIEGYAQDEG
jgi:hypothetical protein